MKIKRFQRLLKKSFQKNIDIEFNTIIKDAKYENNSFNLTLEDDDNKITSYQCENLLYAIGRDSNADTLNLQNTSIDVDKRGFIKRDSFFSNNS